MSAGQEINVQDIPYSDPFPLGKPATEETQVVLESLGCSFQGDRACSIKARLSGTITWRRPGAKDILTIDGKIRISHVNGYTALIK